MTVGDRWICQVCWKSNHQQVIACWKDHLPGQKLGSRIVLVCPADTAYGDSPQPGGPIKPGDSLVFAIDLLDAS